MRESLRIRCESFIENRDIIKEAFLWDGGIYVVPICAAMFAEKGKRADPSRLKECKDLLKTNVGPFSNFKGTAKPVVITELVLDDNPRERLNRELLMYDKLKKHFWDSESLSLAAMVLSGMTDEARFDEVAERAGRIYKLMKAEHPFLTSAEDCVFAGMLALSDKSDEQLIRETEDCFHILQESFSSRNAIQSLSHVLALCEGAVGTKCRAVVELYQELLNKQFKYGTYYELATLGVLAMLPCGRNAVMSDLMEVDNFLSTQKGYGFFGLDKKTRRMHAAILVVSEYMAGVNQNSLLMTSTATNGAIALIEAQQVAICAAIISSVAVTNMSRTSN